MAGEVNVPDEAYDAAQDKVGHRQVSPLTAVLAIQAAAPHIDRAARIDELKNLVVKIFATYESEPGTYDALMVANQVRGRIAELEGRSDDR